MGLDYNKLIYESPKGHLYTAFGSTPYKVHFSNKQKAIEYINAMLRQFEKINQAYIRQVELELRIGRDLKPCIFILQNVHNFNLIREFAPANQLVHLTQIVRTNLEFNFPFTSRQALIDELDLIVYRAQNLKNLKNSR